MRSHPDTIDTAARFGGLQSIAPTADDGPTRSPSGDAGRSTTCPRTVWATRTGDVTARNGGSSDDTATTAAPARSEQCTIDQ